MNTKEKIAVMQAYVDGKPIEGRQHDRAWVTFGGEPEWDWVDWDYRVKSLAQDVIPWDAITDEFICSARDEDGTVVIATHPLVPNTDGKWACDAMEAVFLEDAKRFFNGFERGEVGWRDSLQYRPGHEPKT